MKKVMVALSCLFMFVTSGMAAVTVSWGTSGSTFAYAQDGITKLSAGTSATAGFCQLLYIGAAYDGFTASGTGVLGDDVVLSTSWIGTGAMSAAGTILGTYNNTSYAIGSNFLIRFFNTPSPSYGAGSVPLTGYYGVSQVIVTTQDPFGVPLTENAYFNANYSTVTPVPEPSTVALMLAGLGLVGLRKLRRG